MCLFVCSFFLQKKLHCRFKWARYSVKIDLVFAVRCRRFFPIFFAVWSVWNTSHKNPNCKQKKILTCANDGIFLLISIRNSKMKLSNWFGTEKSQSIWKKNLSKRSMNSNSIWWRAWPYFIAIVRTSHNMLSLRNVCVLCMRACWYCHLQHQIEPNRIESNWINVQ